MPSERLTHLANRYQQLGSFLTNPDARELLRAGEVTHPVRKLAISALLHAPAIGELVYHTSRIAPYAARGHTVLGSGYFSVVLADGPESVMKVYPHTAQLEEAAQHDFIKLFSYRQEVLQRHLSEETSTQTYAIESHPLDNNQSVVIAHQPRLKNDSTPIDFSSARSITSRVDFSGLVEKATIMYEETSMLPDFAGKKNFFVNPDNSITLVDPIALDSRDESNRVGIEKTKTILSHLSKK